MIYAEDLHVGQEFEFGSMTLSEQDILDFARQWDPLRIHTDVAYAKEGPFGQVIASGLHTLAVYQRMMVDGFAYAGAASSTSSCGRSGGTRRCSGMPTFSIRTMTSCWRSTWRVSFSCARTRRE
jgi:hypothetical protein